MEIINYYNSKIYDTYKIIRPFNKDLVASTKTLILDLMYIKNKEEYSFSDFLRHRRSYRYIYTENFSTYLNQKNGDVKS
mgnify:CR=1 FL=1